MCRNMTERETTDDTDSTDSRDTAHGSRITDLLFLRFHLSSLIPQNILCGFGRDLMLMCMIAVTTTWGEWRTETGPAGVVSCHLPSLANTPRAPFAIQHIHATAASDRKHLKAVQRYLDALLAGTPCPLPALVLPEGTAFQQQVWRELMRIPIGATATYGELARRIGKPNASRAVGSACGANPIPLFIPCHRVVGAQGGLGGFSSGLAWKRLLLALESA